MEEPIDINDWTEDNVNTVVKWQTDIEKTSFVYTEILDRANQHIERILVLTLFISTISTLIGSLSVTLGALDYKWIVMAFDIVILIGSAIITFTGGLIKIKGWENTVKTLRKFVEKLDNSWFIFETELSIPPDQRTNAKQFISRMDGEYMYLMQQCPPISGDEYVKATQTYQERLYNNWVWSRKFKQWIMNEKGNDQENSETPSTHEISEDNN